jgi:hypothetical protein
MSWIDTPMVREGKEVSTFQEMIAKLPGPLWKTTSVDKCGEAFVKGIEGRKSRIYCPSWVGLTRWLRPLIATPVGERDIRKFTPDLLPRMDAEATAKDAYLYGFPMVDNYRVQYSYFVDKAGPEYRGGWNEIHNTARVYTPDDKAVQTPNSDTPYSAVGADLRTEPLVLTVPPIEQDRYYSLQFVDGYTYNFAYAGSRTTGNGGGKYLLAGPNWKGDKPEGVNDVIRSDTELALVLYRTQLFGPSDLDSVKKIQAGYQVQPLSAYLNQSPPAPAPAIEFVPPLTSKQQGTSPQFFEILNFALRFASRNTATAVLWVRDSSA